MVGTAPTLDGVIYRNETEAPKETGWYYAGLKSAVGLEIEPVYVRVDHDKQTPEGLIVAGYHYGRLYHWPFSNYVFFGPVAVCREG